MHKPLTVLFLCISIFGCKPEKGSLVIKESAQKGKIMIIGINPATAKYLPSSLREMGYEPVFILDSGRKYEGPAKESLDSCLCLRADLGKDESVSATLKERPDLTKEVAGVMTFLDERFPLVERIGKAFGMKTPGPELALLSEKAEMYRAIPEFCPRGITFQGALWNETDFESVPGDNGWAE